MLNTVTVLTAVMVLSLAAPGLAEVNLHLPVRTEFASARTVNLDSVVTVKGTIKPHVPCSPSFKNYTSQAKSPGLGGVSEGTIVTVEPGTSLVLYRAYSARFNNSIRNWWSASFQYDGPSDLAVPVTTTISRNPASAKAIVYSSSPAIVGAMTEGRYRTDNAICKAWNDLDRVVLCKTQPGATFLIGTTQSVNAGLCEGDWVNNKNAILYPANGTLQVFIETDQIDQATCSDYALQWPKK